MINSEVFDRTICALATGRGGAIGIIRISGAGSIPVCSRIFTPFDKRIIIEESKGYTVIYGEIIDENDVIDEVLVSVFRSPRSYTGEDSVEISCHASVYIQQRILELLISNGAFYALPGEFSQRAFLNGKMDLSQTEAVADLIASESKIAHRIAIDQMRGSFSDKIGILRSELLHFASMIELELDFGEEDVEFADRGHLLSLIKKSLAVSENLTSSFSLGNVIKNGIPVAIIGNPNTGKSTLLNRILNEEKAIVSDIPGTTRDAIEDTCIINGVQFRFIDTAGIRKTDDLVENLGISRTMEKIDKAIIVILVADVNNDSEQLKEFINEIRLRIKGSDKQLIVLFNKVDISPSGTKERISKHCFSEDNEHIVFISAKTGEGIDSLLDILNSYATEHLLSSESVIVTNVRHYEALMQVNNSLKRVISGLEDGLTEDLIAIDLRQAIHYFGMITGHITDDEILQNIFRNFCIGK